MPRSWREGAVALGLNPLRAMLAVTLRAIRPAIVAAAVLATARALGEAVMISMVSGAQLLHPGPLARCADLPVSSRCARSRRRSSTSAKASAPRRSTRRSTRSRAPADLRVRALDRRLPDQAAAAQVPGAGMNTHGRVGSSPRPLAFSRMVRARGGIADECIRP